MTSILLGLALALACGGDDLKPKFVPDEGFVPTEAVAVKIAVAVWEPIYGVEDIARQKPYRATLADGVWTVQGTFAEAEGRKGGVALAEIAKKDGRILRVTHGK